MKKHNGWIGIVERVPDIVTPTFRPEFNIITTFQPSSSSVTVQAIYHQLMHHQAESRKI
jgi:hypothetical protein